MLDSESPGAAESRHLLLLEPEYVRRLSHSLTRKPGRLGDSARKPDGRGRWPDRRPRPRAGGLGLDDHSRHARGHGRPRGPGLAAGAARRAGCRFRPGARPAAAHASTGPLAARPGVRCTFLSAASTRYSVVAARAAAEAVAARTSRMSRCGRADRGKQPRRNRGRWRFQRRRAPELPAAGTRLSDEPGPGSATREPATDRLRIRRTVINRRARRCII